MARINFESRWFSDYRRKLLIRKLDGNELLADGAVLHLWLAAQNRARNNELIPFVEWDTIAFKEAFIEVGLAEMRESGVYVRGMDEHFAWLRQCAESGRKGGLTKASNRKRSLKSITYNSLASAKQTSSKRLAKSSLLLPSSSSSSSSSSSALSQNNNTYADSNVEPETPPQAGTPPAGRQRVKVFTQELELIYKTKYPRKEGKAQGMVKLYREIKTTEDLALFDQAVTNFATHHKKRKTEPQYLKHFSTFASEWRDWIDPDHGSVSSEFTAQKSQGIDWDEIKKRIELEERADNNR